MPIPNSFVYTYKTKFSDITPIKYSLNARNIAVKIGEYFYVFVADTKDFSDEEIEGVYQKEQIYINTHFGKVSTNFIADYKKLVKKDDYFEVEGKNLFEQEELAIENILKKIFIGKCLDVGCGDTRYKDIFLHTGVEYEGIDIMEVNNGLNVSQISFEEFSPKGQYQSIFFFRSINHFEYTLEILDKAYRLLDSGGYLFIVENELFGEVKFPGQMFEGQAGDYEHFHNYSLALFQAQVDLSRFEIITSKAVSSFSANQWYICLQKK